MTKRIRVDGVRVTIGGVEFRDVDVTSFTFSAAPPDPRLELRWAAWFDRAWEAAGRRHFDDVVGLSLAAVRLGHEQRARGEPIFPRPFA